MRVRTLQLSTIAITAAALTGLVLFTSCGGKSHDKTDVAPQNAPVVELSPLGKSIRSLSFLAPAADGRADLIVTTETAGVATEPNGIADPTFTTTRLVGTLNAEFTAELTAELATETEAPLTGSLVCADASCVSWTTTLRSPTLGEAPLAGSRTVIEAAPATSHAGLNVGRPFEKDLLSFVRHADLVSDNAHLVDWVANTLEINSVVGGVSNFLAIQYTAFKSPYLRVDGLSVESIESSMAGDLDRDQSNVLVGSSRYANGKYTRSSSSVIGRARFHKKGALETDSTETSPTIEITVQEEGDGKVVFALPRE